MKTLGMWLAIFGFGSLALNLFGYDFRLLSFLDSMGQTAGMAIRAGAGILGAVLFFLGMKQEGQNEEA